MAITSSAVPSFTPKHRPNRSATPPWNSRERSQLKNRHPSTSFKSLERAEWDTLMFFYGIILCVGGLGTLGFLAVGSELMSGDLGPTTANILVGLLSAIIETYR